MNKIILDLCGGTGSWSKPYAEAGYQVIIVTLPDCDVLDFAKDFRRNPYPVHGILAAPPCDHFSVSGAQYWQQKDKDGRTRHALKIVDACLNVVSYSRCKWWALENPVGRLRQLRKDVLGEPLLVFNPCDYGDPYTKKTLLWGSFNIPKKKPVEPIRACEQGSWLQKLGGKSTKTKLLRSMTPQGFAKAFFEANP
jgi:hypothetical protein